MTQTSPRPPRRRLKFLIGAGFAVIAVGVVVRLATTEAIPRWRADRMSDTVLAQAAAKQNASFAYVFAWARRLEANARFPEAETVYRWAMEISPTNVDSWLGNGRTAFAAGHWGNADAVLSKTVAQWPENAEARFVYASILASTFRDRKAATQLQAGLKYESGRGQAWQTLGDLEMRLENPTAAADAYAHAKALLPPSELLLARYGAALSNAGKHAQAQSELEAALNENPADTNARFLLGKDLGNSGRAQDEPRAVLELDRVIQFADNKSRAYVEVARIWLRQSDLGNAVQALEHALDLNPYNPETLKLLAKAYRDENRVAEAQRTEKALAQAETHVAERRKILSDLDNEQNIAASLLQLGRIDRDAHNIIEAQAAFAAARAVAPDNLEAARELDRLTVKPTAKAQTQHP